ncbi:MAG: non-ribosomal peptide synthetase, partial [Chlamydiota bacterium]|nr:non-ribosomal peptide synthetase [Chlamydiota bacterium]
VKQQITTIHFVPSMLQTFLDDKDIGQCTSLKRVICSGEALSYALQRKFFQTLDTQLHNLYGPTEAAIDVCFWACQKEDKNPIVPIGRPVANTQIYILDSERQIVPIGVIGELAIGGVQVAKGYLNRPELTSEKFINDPFRPHTNAMLYRTGDLARTRSDGAIEFLGRMDHQIKIRGYRVELGEIESTILQHPLIQETAVILSHHIQNDTVLVGYIIPRANQCSEKELTADLRNFLKATLPSYMIPRIFVILESMPMFPNGKVNRQALPSPTQTESKIIEDETVAPRNNAEVLLIKIWKKVLETDQVSIHDNFFDIGGHSLLSLEVISRIYKETGIRLSPRTMLMNSLEQIAPHLIDDTSSRGIKSASLMQRILKKIKDPKP